MCIGQKVRRRATPCLPSQAVEGLDVEAGLYLAYKYWDGA